MLAETQVPAIEDLLESPRVGRCFVNAGTYAVFGAMVKFKKINADVGPIGDQYPEYSVSCGTSEPGAYDNVSLEDVDLPWKCKTFIVIA